VNWYFAYWLHRATGKEKVNARARGLNGAKFLGLNSTWIEEIDVIRDIIKKSSGSACKGE
jgi:hypothetical protein